MIDAVVILQARMGSVRLPGKSLAPLVGGASVVAMCLARLVRAGVAQVLLATTSLPEDDRLEAAASALGVPAFRGPCEDVLTRFLRAAGTVSARFVVRATADNPAVDVDAPRRVLDALVTNGSDHVVEAGLPYGSAVEAVTVDALERADCAADDARDREHVTSLIRRNRTAFASITPLCPPPLRRPDLRFTIDTPDDLVYMRSLLARIPEPLDAPLAFMIEEADRLAGSRALESAS